jgi:hypothetical protein
MTIKSLKKLATKFNTYFGPVGNGAMRLVIMESPYRGDTPEQTVENLFYARCCLKDCLDRGEAPIASHLLYTQVLNDTDPKQRQHGIEAGLAWMRRADASVIYTDRGISEGMRKGIEAARFAGIPTELRTLKDVT